MSLTVNTATKTHLNKPRFHINDYYMYHSRTVLTIGKDVFFLPNCVFCFLTLIFLLRAYVLCLRYLKCFSHANKTVFEEIF